MAAIRSNAAINDFGQIEIVHAAAGAHDGAVELILTEDSLWSRTSTVGEHALEIRRDLVSAITLDALALDGLLRSPHVVKIDVEGADLDVLAGMTRLLAQSQPVVICELHGRNAEFCEIMAKAGYRVTNLDSSEHVSDAPGNVHALAEPPGWRLGWPGGT